MTEDTPLKGTLLIVDDQPVNIQALSRLLKTDYRILIATSGAKALEIAGSTNHPDLILLDIQMPEMDGYEVCTRLKGDTRTRSIPVIFVTARTSPEDEEKGLTLGAVDYISKPFNPEIVKARVKTQIDRIRAEEEIRLAHERLSLAADAAGFGTWDLDLETFHMAGDDWMNRLYGISADGFPGTFDAWIQMIHTDDLELVVREYEAAIHGEKPFDTEYRITRPDGAVRYLKAYAAVTRDANHVPVRMTGVNYDITTKKEYETEIIRYAEQLELQTLSLEELTDKLSVTNQELDERVRQRTEEISHLLVVKADLITQIGHDLKTPLTPLIALLPHIRKKTSDPELQELLDVLIMNSQRMKRIISNILLLATFEVSRAEDLRGESGLSKIADQIIKEEGYSSSQNNLTLINHLSPDLIIRMNKAHCDLILSNIISNAVKYSLPSGTITISYELSDSTFTLIVTDDGQGIGPEHLPRIFEEFYKADKSRHDNDSSGLGLSLVQRIVRSYGGAITAASEGEGKGSVFRVTFPADLCIRM